MSRTPACHACGYTLTFPDDPVESVTICPRCNRLLAKDDTNVGLLMLQGAGVTVFWIAVLLFVGVCLLSTPFVVHTGDGRHDEAALKAQNIQKACVAFNISHDRFPEALDELVKPISGKGPLLEGGEAAITDPWNKPYQLELIEGPNDTKRVVVWTTTPEGKRIQWPRE